MRAIDRHVGWAMDFVRAGDFDLAHDAVEDASALAAELCS
jgi:hypothetical protein